MVQIVPFEREDVSGFLHRPEGAASGGVVLTHGAGGNCNAPLLVAAAAAFSVAGFEALRIDLPFRQRRPKGPPSPAGAVADRAGLRLAVAALRAIVWFTSTESFAKVLSAGNRELLRVIAEKAPGSLDELARITGRAKSNLSRTLKTMAGYGLVRLERGERGRISPRVTHDRVELDLPLTHPERHAEP